MSAAGQKSAKSKRKLRSALIAELSRLSRDGWRSAKPCDYQPIEQELAALSKAEA